MVSKLEKNCYFNLFQVLLGSIVEVSALCYLTIVVLTVMDVKSDVMLLLMNCVFLVPSVSQLFRSDFCSKKGRSFMFTMASIFQIGGLFMLVYTVCSLRIVRILFHLYF